MTPSVIFVVCLIPFYVDSTDIAAVYKHGILLLRNVNKYASSSGAFLQSSSSNVNISLNLQYPIGLVYDSHNENFYISDANDKNTEIFMVPMKNGSSSTLHPYISQMRHSAIDAISISPRNNEIYWTDSIKHGIYFASINGQNNEAHSPLLLDQNVLKPRGIAVDSCRQKLYWTERDNKNTPVIKSYNLASKSVNVLKNGLNGTYFQGIFFNPSTKELIWAETLGDEEHNSSCKIVSMSSDGRKQTILGSFDNCYPFSLVSDNDYVYWSDWARHGVVRLSRKDPQNLVKLVDTPLLKTSEGVHNGAFGITLINDKFDESICSNHGLTTYNSLSESYSNAQEKKAENLQIDVILAASDSVNPDGSESDSTTNVRSSASSFRNENSYYQMRKAVIILAMGCAFFISTTLILFIRNYGVFQKIQGHFTPPSSPKPVERLGKIKKHRTFGPKSKISDLDLCPRAPDDGVKIDIEYCCQMTLCDTPCYTRVKKEGKGYGKFQNNAGDKIQLLSDPENAF